MTASKINSDSKELIKKFFEKRYPADIEKRFHLWLLDETDREEKEIALEDMWETVPYGSPQQAKGSLEIVREKLGFPATPVRPLRRSIVLKIASVIIPFMVIAGGYMLWQNRPAANIADQVAYMEARDGAKVVLPDNSVVEVKEGLLVYPEEFRDEERRVKFDGSAYFTVNGDTGRPFVVEGTLLNVRVTGTEFMVSTGNDLTSATVSLVKGSVDVIIGEMEPITLQQGKELTYDSVSGDIEIEELPDALTNKDAFTEGRMVFSKATLGDILRSVAKVHGMEISLPSHLGGETLYEVKFTGDESLMEILDVLKLLSDGFNYQLHKKQIIIE